MLALYSEEHRELIFEKDGGRCHYCGRTLDINAYAMPSSSGGWFIDRAFSPVGLGFPSDNTRHACCFHCSGKTARLITL